MSEENKAIVRRGIEKIWNQGNLLTVEEILATNYLRHDPDSPDMRGLEVMKKWSHVRGRRWLISLVAHFP